MESTLPPASSADTITELPVPRKRGRQPFNPTDEMRAEVINMGRLGLCHQQIATAFDMDIKTLRKHFRCELAAAAAKANVEVIEKIYQMALEGNLTAAIFWAKSRCDFRVSGQPLDDVSQTSDSPESKSVAYPPPHIITVYNNDGEPNADA